jgi:hypothetical protein
MQMPNQTNIAANCALLMPWTARPPAGEWSGRPGVARNQQDVAYWQILLQKYFAGPGAQH